MKITYIIVIILLVIIILLYNKRENFLVNTEAVGNIASVYADVSGIARFNNIKTQNLDVFNNINILQNKVKLNNLDISGNLNINNVDISGNLRIDGILTKKENVARYVIVGNKLKSGIDSQTYWTIHEVEIYDSSGTNIALNKPVTIISGKTEHPNTSVWGLPGNITSGHAKNEDTDFYHAYDKTDNELQIDLGKEYDIKQIIIYNRWNWNATERANNTSIQLLDSNRKVNRIIFTGNWNQAYSKEFML